MSSRRLLSVVAGISLVYDLATGLALLVATDRLASLFGAPVPDPILFAKLNGLFLIAVGLGYAQPMLAPERHRAYLWVFGTFLKGAGAALFVLDHVLYGSPTSFLLFAASDGALAALTTWALVRPPATTTAA